MLITSTTTAQELPLFPAFVTGVTPLIALPHGTEARYACAIDYLIFTRKMKLYTDTSLEVRHRYKHVHARITLTGSAAEQDVTEALAVLRQFGLFPYHCQAVNQFLRTEQIYVFSQHPAPLDDEHDCLGCTTEREESAAAAHLSAKTPCEHDRRAFLVAAGLPLGFGDHYDD